MTHSTQLPQVAPCDHTPHCPPADATNHDEAVVIASHHEQGFVLLCILVIVFDDTGELSPAGVPTAPHRNEVRLQVSA